MRAAEEVALETKFVVERVKTEVVLYFFDRPAS